MLPMGWGVPPEAGMRHKMGSPRRGEENTRSRPSCVQAGGPEIRLLSKVSRFGSPPVIGTTNKSFAAPEPLSRRNATDAPSGANAGAESEPSSRGDVSGRVVESVSENDEIL
jgi:hypothetical protein